MKDTGPKIIITGGSGFIGSYIMDEFIKQGIIGLINMDIAEPIEKEHLSFWRKTDILDKDAVQKVFEEFQPNYVIHLAARTDTPTDVVLEDYKSNTDGTSNVLSAIKTSPSVERVVITSTQFVHQYQGMPKHDEDYAPHTVYGESKIISEQLTREAGLNCCWTIIRPTNIWGPRHPRYTAEFWYVLKKGRYIHPGRQEVIRSYGYVGTVVGQIMTILNEEKEKVNKQVFYVGDEPLNLYDWANGFSLALNNRPVKVVPRFVVKSFAYIGDVLKFLQIKFPITSSRYKSMTNTNTAPMEKTFQVLGRPKYSLEEGIAETVDWLKKQDKFWGE